MDVTLKVVGFGFLYKMVAAWPVTASPRAGVRERRIVETCDAVDRARTWYFKHAWCLQSAAAAVCLLRLRGFPAGLVIGVRKLPFYAHAWVEIEGGVVLNAEPALGTLYRVIARC